MNNSYEAFDRRSLEDKENFWAEEAERIHWHKKWDQVLDYSKPPFARWFVGGETNLCYNAVDRHVADRGNQKAIVWISSELGKTQEYTYAELHEQVNRYAAVMQDHGLTKGDRVIIYLPMIAEAVFTILACVRLGATHSVVFGGFAPANLAQRIDDAKPKLLITADAGMRGGKPYSYKPLVDKAVELCDSKPGNILYINRGLDKDMPLTPGRDVDLAAAAEGKAGARVEPTWVESNHPSYILYTSGTTGKPKGVQRDTGGYATALTGSMKHIYGCNPGETYLCTSDIGWVVGHSYIIYAPLLYGMTSIVYEGTPLVPDPGVWWKIVEDYKASVMFSSPTAIRILRKQDPKYMSQHDTSSLRHLFLAGEPLDAPSYDWVKQSLGREVVDHMWQTESGWPMLSNCVGIEQATIKPGSPTFPVYGWDLKVVEPGSGKVMGASEKGVMVAQPPLPPGALTTIWEDDKRFIESYFSSFSDLYYYTGDYAIQDEDGYFFVLGRADEVINVAGHRLGTREVEEAISGHPAVAEAAAVGVKDEVKGQAIVAFVVVKNDVTLTHEEIEAEVKKQVDTTVGAIARPREVHVVNALPKTRSGKVIRRAITAMAEGRETGDLSTLEDPAAIEGIDKALHEEH